MRIKIAPSILSADLSCIREELRKCEEGGADLIHVDVMDGHFVPNITMGPVVVKWVKRSTSLPVEVHLMIEDPARYAENFAQSGADWATVHVESKTAKEAVKKFRDLGLRVGVALNPDTPPNVLENFDYDYILVMTVYPGFSGQKFIEWASNKITEIRDFFKGDVMVDGGINVETAGIVVRKGANILAAASAVFKGDVAENIRNLRRAAESAL